MSEFAVKAFFSGDLLYFRIRCVVVERNGTEFGLRLKWRLRRTSIEKREPVRTEHNDCPQPPCLDFDAALGQIVPRCFGRETIVTRSDARTDITAGGAVPFQRMCLTLGASRTQGNLRII